MLVWLIKDGEHLPVQSDVRPMRTWMLATGLIQRGHAVVWWSSTFSHQRKQLIAAHDVTTEVAPRFTLRMLHAGEYHRNVSVLRAIHHRTLARRLVQEGRRAERPDLIVCCLPTLSLVKAAASLARFHDVPLYYDVRDLWPDAFVNLVPQRIRPVASLLAQPWFRRVGALLRAADGVIAVSPGYLTWALKLAARPRRSSDAVYPLGTIDPGKSRLVANASVQDKTPVVFVFAGSFGRSYNLELVCEVAERLKDEGCDDIHFSFVGAGDQYSRIAERTAALSNVQLHGWVGRAALVRHLQLADVGLVPCISAPNTMNNKLYEYLSMGLPQICSLAGDAQRMIEERDVGIYYPDGDAGRLYDAVVRLARDPELRHRQARNARKLFEEQFDATALYERYARHLESAVASGTNA